MVAVLVAGLIQKQIKKKVYKGRSIETGGGMLGLSQH